MKDTHMIRQTSNHARAVKEIAFQADLLALQAAVAMAGAGPNAMEFAVAADGVRDLARLGVQVSQGHRVLEQEHPF